MRARLAATADANSVRTHDREVRGVDGDAPGPIQVRRPALCPRRRWISQEAGSDAVLPLPVLWLDQLQRC